MFRRRRTEDQIGGDAASPPVDLTKVPNDPSGTLNPLHDAPDPAGVIIDGVQRQSKYSQNPDGVWNPPARS